MKTQLKTKIGIKFYEDQVIKLFRNGRCEIKIFGGTQQLVDYLEQLINKENDYEDYMKHIQFENGKHLGSWLFDVLSRDIDREFADLLQNSIVVVK